ncbi:vesicular inhibitory amino acid transporter [Lepeophtheirus salmonis]|uniref:Vesicular inhibitory amino acid transporter n=1 Tax=Lepeophtheirus salmonis TaxID=72036 RepID=A0A0K2UAU4_LEPSM|nr:vesicular inhibitory amino acid transporter-like [Lepeophtheirus salmonis]
MATLIHSCKDWVTSKVTPECLKSSADDVKRFAREKTGKKDDDDPTGKMEEYKKTGKITEWEAAWNVTNAIQGMFIVSLPYGVYHGGYWAILAMVGIAHICCHTGKILVECLYEPDERGELVKVRFSYNEIAQECFGKKYGGKIINAAQLIELLMTCILYVVLCGDLLIGAFPKGSIDTRSYMMICGLLLLPCAFLKNLTHVSHLSFWNGIVHTVINIVILGYCLTRIGSWGWSKVTMEIDILSFPIALGVIVFSYTSQIFLPTLEGNMIDKSKFECMLNWSHVAAAIFKGLFGYIGFLTWQEDTQEEVVNNLEPTLKTLVNIILVVKALLSYPLPYYAACEMLEKELFQGKPATVFPTIWALDGDLKVWGLAFRVIVICVTIVFAVVIPHFTILMGFIGSFTGCFLSFIWPSIFHLYLKRKVMPMLTMGYDIFIIALGVFFGILGMYYSGRAMERAFELGVPV